MGPRQLWVFWKSGYDASEPGISFSGSRRNSVQASMGWGSRGAESSSFWELCLVTRSSGRFSSMPWGLRSNLHSPYEYVWAPRSQLEFPSHLLQNWQNNVNVSEPEGQTISVPSRPGALTRRLFSISAFYKCFFRNRWIYLWACGKYQTKGFFKDYLKVLSSLDRVGEYECTSVADTRMTQ